MEDGGKELYNLKNDPAEEHNIYDQEREIGATLFLSLTKWLSQNPENSFPKADSKEVLETLKSLGYI